LTRPAAADDAAFLAALDRERVAAPLAGLPEELRSQLLDQQVEAHRRSRTGAETLVIERGGRRIGLVRLRRGEEDHVIDLEVVPAERNQGIGAAVLDEVLDPLRPTCLETEAGNLAARRFYARLGFVVVGDDGVYVSLRRAPGRVV
jgi:GNAT superfamily N-acetyltransferase